MRNAIKVLALETLVLSALAFPSVAQQPQKNTSQYHNNSQAFASSESLDSQLNKGIRYFNQGEKTKKFQDYESALKIFDKILDSNPVDEQKRQALFYSAKSLQYGVRKKNPKEAVIRYQSVIDYGVKDDITQQAIGSMATINFKNAMSNVPGFSLAKSYEMFEKLANEFPDGKYLNYVKSKMAEIKRINPKLFK